MGFTITNHCLPASPSESDCKFQANMYLLLRMFNMLDKLLPPPFATQWKPRGTLGTRLVIAGLPAPRACSSGPLHGLLRVESVSQVFGQWLAGSETIGNLSSYVHFFSPHVAAIVPWPYHYRLSPGSSVWCTPWRWDRTRLVWAQAEKRETRSRSVWIPINGQGI